MMRHSFLELRPSSVCGPGGAATDSKEAVRKEETARSQECNFLFVYTWTSICAVGYTNSVESVFEIIAEPNRRAILSLLVSSQQSVGEIERQLRMPRATVSAPARVGRGRFRGIHGGRRRGVSNG